MFPSLESRLQSYYLLVFSLVVLFSVLVYLHSPHLSLYSRELLRLMAWTSSKVLERTGIHLRPARNL